MLHCVRVVFYKTSIHHNFSNISPLRSRGDANIEVRLYTGTHKVYQVLTPTGEGLESRPIDQEIGDGESEDDAQESVLYEGHVNG